MINPTMIRILFSSLRQRAGSAAILGLTILQGCALPGAPNGAPPGAVTPAIAAKPAPRPAPGPAAPETRSPAAVDTPEVLAQQAVAAGVEAYNRGEYQGAIRKLTTPEVAAGEKPAQLTALKYSAFSYCLTKRVTLCRQQFDKAFKLDPAFDLAPGEKGHPLWGPSFDLAKKANSPHGPKVPVKKAS